MKITTILLSLTVCFALAGCQLTARVPSPVEIKVDGNNGTHCPPGQAKKGNC